MAGAHRAVSDRPLVFITGMFRSGSTLFEQVLAAHPGVTPGGEIDYFGRALGSTGRPFPASASGLDAAALQQLGLGYLKYLERTFPGDTLITNKRPDAFAWLGLLKGLFPNARFVNTVRDPLDTCLSIYVQQLDERLTYATDLQNIAHYFLQYRRLMEHWEELFGERIFDAVYDAYVAEREPTTRALLDFLELPWNEACLETPNVSSRVRTASVWQVREPVYRRSSGRWRNYERHLAPVRELLLGE
ncbi:MAG: sulfotransferase [Gammaproteobacteria bacterium]|nr:sulfotransferase [Gammaproteobacteria bacterium]